MTKRAEFLKYIEYREREFKKEVLLSDCMCLHLRELCLCVFVNVSVFLLFLSSLTNI